MGYKLITEEIRISLIFSIETTSPINPAPVDGAPFWRQYASSSPSTCGRKLPVSAPWYEMIPFARSKLACTDLFATRFSKRQTVESPLGISQSRIQRQSLIDP